MELNEAGRKADELIAAEVSIQDRMWGESNERADAGEGQLIRASVAQVTLVAAIEDIGGDGSGKMSVDEAVEAIKSDIYPKDWDGFRSYGSGVANLVVAAAYLRSEIKRRIAAGEDTVRTKRGEPYVRATPYMSSAEAAGHGQKIVTTNEAAHDHH